MMICPTTYVEECENMTFKELIKERNNLVADIKQLEKAVFAKDRTGEEWQICPSPEVRYQTKLEYLSELFDLMSRKYREERE